MYKRWLSGTYIFEYNLLFRCSVYVHANAGDETSQKKKKKVEGYTREYGWVMEEEVVVFFDTIIRNCFRKGTKLTRISISYGVAKCVYRTRAVV